MVWRERNGAEVPENTVEKKKKGRGLVRSADLLGERCVAVRMVRFVVVVVVVVVRGSKDRELFLEA